MSDQDHRRAMRKRVLKGALIAYNNRSSTMSCAVRDLSETGARLRVVQGQAVPSRFDLIVESDGLDVPCAVVWRRGEEIGVAFERPPERKPPVRTQLATPSPAGRPPSLLRKPLR